MESTEKKSNKIRLVDVGKTTDLLLELRRGARSLRTSHDNELTVAQRKQLAAIEAIFKSIIGKQPKIMLGRLDSYVLEFLSSEKGTMAYQSSVFAEKGKTMLFTDYLDVIAAYVRERSGYVVFALDIHESLNRVMLQGNQ